MNARISWRVPATLAAAGLIAVAGCGGTDKPAYCGDRTDLQDAVKGLPGAATSGNPDKLRSQLETVQSDAKTLVDSAKSDFPSETDAITRSVSATQDSLNALPPNPTASDLAQVATGAANIVTSVKNFSDATNSKCD